MSKKLTKEDSEAKTIAKQQKKLFKRYTIFKFAKPVALILLALFVVATVCFGYGMQTLNTSTPVSDDAQIMDMGLTIMLIAGVIGYVVLPFLIYRRFSLIVILMGTALWDISLVFKDMFLEGEGIMGLMLVLFGILGLLLAERRRNKQKGNRKLSMNQDLYEGFVKIANSNDDKVLDALHEVAYIETSYKASLYFTLSLLTVALTGIGLILPFGKKSYSYNRYLFFLTSDWDEMKVNESDMESAKVSYEKFKNYKYKNEKPYAFLLDGVMYYNGTPYKVTQKNGNCNYSLRANSSIYLSFVYTFVFGLIFEMSTKKQSFMRKKEMSLGDFVFSEKDVAKTDKDFAQMLVNYSVNQSEENKQELIEGLNEWYETSQRENRAELERIDRYEQERDRVKGLNAVETSVKTDGKDNYVYGYDAEGNKKQYKLDEYDEKTNIGTYTDENGKKVTIKNNN